MDNHCQTKKREITPKVRKAGLSFLYAIRRLVLFYISTKYHQNIPKGIQVRADMKFYADADVDANRIRPKTICPPPPLVVGGGWCLIIIIVKKLSKIIYCTKKETFAK